MEAASTLPSPCVRRAELLCGSASSRSARLYDALASDESAVQAMGDNKLKVSAAELITKVRQSVTIDWTLRESARARIKAVTNSTGASTPLRSAPENMHERFETRC